MSISFAVIVLVSAPLWAVELDNCQLPYAPSLIESYPTLPIVKMEPFVNELGAGQLQTRRIQVSDQLVCERLLTRYKIDGSHGGNGYQRSQLTDVVKAIPPFAKAFHFSSCRHGDYVFEKYPDVDALAAIIADLRRRGDPQAPGFGVEEARNDGISDEDFLRMIQRKAVPYARRGTYHHHDIGRHMISWLLIEAEVADFVSESAEILLKFKDNPILKKNVWLMNRLDSLIGELAQHLDQNTGIVEPFEDNLLRENSIAKIQNGLGPVLVRIEKHRLESLVVSLKASGWFFGKGTLIREMGRLIESTPFEREIDTRKIAEKIYNKAHGL